MLMALVPLGAFDLQKWARGKSEKADSIISCATSFHKSGYSHQHNSGLIQAAKIALVLCKQQGVLPSLGR